MFRGVSTILLSILLGAAYSHASAGADSTGFLLPESTHSELNLVLETVKVLGALGLTLVLLIVFLVLLRKIMRAKGIQGVEGATIQILAIQHIDPKKAVALVRILDRVLIVGCAEQSLTNLGELSLEDIDRLNVKNHRVPPGLTGGRVFKTILARFAGSDAQKPPNG